MTELVEVAERAVAEIERDRDEAIERIRAEADAELETWRRIIAVGQEQTGDRPSPSLPAPKPPRPTPPNRGGRKPKPLDGADLQIARNLLAREGKVGIRPLVKLGLTETTARKAIEALVEEGAVVPVGTGRLKRWEPPPSDPDSPEPEPPPEPAGANGTAAARERRESIPGRPFPSQPASEVTGPPVDPHRHLDEEDDEEPVYPHGTLDEKTEEGEVHVPPDWSRSASRGRNEDRPALKERSGGPGTLEGRALEAIRFTGGASKRELASRLQVSMLDLAEPLEKLLEEDEVFLTDGRYRPLSS